MQVLNTGSLGQEVTHCLEPFLMYLAPCGWQQLQKTFRKLKSTVLITPLYWCTKTLCGHFIPIQIAILKTIVRYYRVLVFSTK